MVEQSLLFDGLTFDQKEDGARLAQQLRMVFALMEDSKWRTLSQISLRDYFAGQALGMSEWLGGPKDVAKGAYEIADAIFGFVAAQKAITEYLEEI